MVELVLTFILKLVGLGLGYYLVHSIFSNLMLYLYNITKKPLRQERLAKKVKLFK